MDTKSFQKWYDTQDQTVKEQMKRFVLEGRFEFVVSAGQPYSHIPYDLLIDQVEDSLEFLYEEFAVRPQVAWQVSSDAYSLEVHKEMTELIRECNQNATLQASQTLNKRVDHSHPASYARLFSELGFDALLIDRPEQPTEHPSFIWRPESTHFQS